MLSVPRPKCNFLLWQRSKPLGRDWGRWLPFVLFVYMEVPQASTGFSPVSSCTAGKSKDRWTCCRREAPTVNKEDRSIVKFVLEMRDRWLERYSEQARENLQQAQQTQNKWHDQKARLCQFQPGQKVLLLLLLREGTLLIKQTLGEVAGAIPCCEENWSGNLWNSPPRQKKDSSNLPCQLTKRMERTA